MSLTSESVAQLRKLEESLWLRSTRFDNAYMRGILADDFREFGQSGRHYDRSACLAMPEQDIDVVLPLPCFAVREIAPGVALVTYVTGGATPANRSSLWTRDGSGWKLRFHQGTPLV